MYALEETEDLPENLIELLDEEVSENTGNIILFE